jgi:16S rRNA processing protein RimM
MRKVAVGVMSKTHGVKGELKLLADVYDDKLFKKLKKIYANGVCYDIERAKIAGGYIIIKLKGIDGVDTASALKNCVVEIDEQDRLELPPNTYYISELIGCRVFFDDKTEVGEVVDIAQNGAADVYVLRSADNSEIMFPALKDLLQLVDTANKTIIIDKKRFGETAVF